MGGDGRSRESQGEKVAQMGLSGPGNRETPCPHPAGLGWEGEPGHQGPSSGCPTGPQGSSHRLGLGAQRSL